MRFLLVGRTAPTLLLASVRTAVSSVKPRALLARLRAVLACDARAELERVTVPILYLRVTQDRLVDVSCLEEIIRIKPEVVVEAIDGPHLLLQAYPQQTAEIVAGFVKQVP
jgi:pimeloyl-ACP methyl ester carboxylesterase